MFLFLFISCFSYNIFLLVLFFLDSFRSLLSLSLSLLAIGDFIHVRCYLATNLIQTLGTGFATLNNMHLTMLRRYWWGTRLTWMKAKGNMLDQEQASHKLLIL